MKRRGDKTKGKVRMDAKDISGRLYRSDFHVYFGSFEKVNLMMTMILVETLKKKVKQNKSE
jgi:hypothetical protein